MLNTTVVLSSIKVCVTHSIYKIQISAGPCGGVLHVIIMLNFSINIKLGLMLRFKYQFPI